MTLNETQEKLCSESTTDYSDIKAVLINTSLKRNPADGHTRSPLDGRPGGSIAVTGGGGDAGGGGTARLGPNPGSFSNARGSRVESFRVSSQGGAPSRNTDPGQRRGRVGAHRV